MTTRKRITAAFLALCLFLSMTPVSLAADGVSVTEAQDVLVETLGEEGSAEPASDAEVSEEEDTGANSALVYRDIYWDSEGNPYDIETENHTELTLERGTSAKIRFYFFDGESYTRVSCSELSVSSDVIYIWETSMGYEGASAQAFGDSSIDYTTNGVTYSLPVSVSLPAFGFYTTSEPSAESYTNNLAISEGNKLFYFAGTDGYLINEVTLDSSLDAIADVEISADRTYATITVTGEPSEDGQWYSLCHSGEYASGEIIVNQWNGLVLSYAPVGLVFRWAYWNGNESDDQRSLSVTKYYSTDVRFYFFDGTSYERINVENLTVTGDVVSLEEDTTYDWVNLTAQLCGEGSVDYTVGEVTYSIPFTVCLPDWGYYSSSSSSEDTYLVDYTVCNIGDAIYFVGPEGYTITSVTLDDSFDAIADAETLGTNYVKITFTSAPAGQAWCSLSFNAATDGSSFENWSSGGIVISNGIPSTGIRYAGRENGEVIVQSWSTFTTAPADSIASNPSVIFYFGTTDSYAPIEGIVSVTAADPAILTVSYWEDTVDGYPAYELDYLKPGTTELIITTEDGSEYRIPYTVVLSSPWMFSTADFDENTAITSFTITEDADTFYFVCQNDWTMDSVTVEEEYVDAFECEKVSDNAFSIRVIDPSKIPSGNRVRFTANYSSSWGSYTNSVWFELINGLPRLVYRYVNSNSLGELTENEYDNSTWCGSPGRSWTRFYFFDGESYTRVPASSLTSGNSKIAYVEDAEDQDVTWLYTSVFGDTTIDYTAENNTTYSVSVSVVLPNYAFYSQSEPTTESYLPNGFTVTEDCNTFYFCALDDCTITDFAFSGVDEGIVTAELSADGSYITFTVNKDVDFEGSYRLTYSGTQYNWSFSNHGYGVRIRSGLPRLVFRNTWRDGNGELQQSNDRTSWDARLHNGMSVLFYFYNGSEYIPVSMDELVVTNEVVSFEAEDGEEYYHMNSANFGEGEIQYTAENETVYSVPVFIGLPTCGYYTTPEATFDSYVEEFTVAEAGQNLYFIALEGYTISEFELANGLDEIATANLSEDKTYVTITFHSAPQNGCHYGLRVNGYTPEGDEFTNWRRYLCLYNSMPALVYRWAWWANDVVVESEDVRTNWSGSPGRSWVRFYFFDGETYTRVPVSELSTSDSNIAYVEHAEDGDYEHLYANNFGEATISYTKDDVTYSLPVSVTLPDWGLYSTSEASAESYLQDGLTVTRDSKTAYLVPTDTNHTITEISVEEDLTDIAEVTIAENGKYVIITVTGDPEEDRWYDIWLSGTYDEGGTFERHVNIQLKNGLPRLVFRYIGYWEDNVPIEEDWAITRWDTDKGDSRWGRFYFFDGKSYTRVYPSELVSSDESVFTVQPCTFADCDQISANEFGTATVSYTVDGETYSFPITVSLPDFGYYSTPYASEESFLPNGFTVTDAEGGNVLYFCTRNDYIITEFSLTSEIDGTATAVLSEDGTCITITFDKNTDFAGHYHLRYNGCRGDWSFTNWGYGISVNNGLPHLAFGGTYWENDQLFEEDWKETRWDTMRGAGWDQLRFYFFDGETYTQVDADDLVVEGSVTLEWYDEWNYGTMIATDFGEGTISYTLDGVTYSVKVSVGLPEWGFFSTSTPSEDSFLGNEFTVTEENRTFYYAGTNGGVVTSVTLNEDFEEIADAEVVNGQIVITVTGTPESGRWYGFSYNGTTYWGYEFEGWARDVCLKNGLPRLFYHSIDWDNEGYYEREDEESHWNTVIGYDHHVRFYFFDGETYIRVPIEDLTASGTVSIEEKSAWDCVRMIAEDFGTGVISYTWNDMVYTTRVTVGLPELGFYSTPAPTEASYLRHFIVSETRNTFYLAGLADWTIQAVELTDGFENIAEVEMLDGYAKITVTGTPENRWYPARVYVDSPYGWSDWWWVDIELEAATPKLVYHYLFQDETGAFYEDEQVHSDEWYNWKGSGNYLNFYFDNGDGVYTPVTLSQLTVTGDAVSLKLDEATGHIYVSADQIGYGCINYTTEDETVYSLTVQVGLPPYAFFSTPERSIASYVEEYAVSNEDNTFYFVTDDSYTIGSFTLDEELAGIATVELLTDHCLAITVNEIPTDDWYGLKVELIHQDGWTFSNAFGITLRAQTAYLTGKIYLPENLDDEGFFVRLSDNLNGYAMIAVNADTIQTDENGKYITFARYSPAEFYGCTTSVFFTLVDYEGTLLNSQTHYARIPYVCADGSLVYGGFYNTPYIQIPADGACELNFTLPTWDEGTSDVFAESDHGVTELGEYNHTHSTTGATGYWLHFDPRTDLDALTINGKLYSLTKLFGKALYVDASATNGKLTIFCGMATFDAPVFGFAITHIEAVSSTTSEGDSHTFRIDDAISSNWNPHTWAESADSTVLDLVMTPLCDLTIKDSTTGEYQWIFVAAESINDVTADHQDDLTKYNCAEAKATAGYVYEIKLNPAMCWEDGTPINADTYIYSMNRLLSSELGNLRANNYMNSESTLAGAEGYHYSGISARIDNSLTNELDEFVEGENGVYTQPNGLAVWIALHAPLDWLGDNSLSFYVDRLGSSYFDVDAYNALLALADEDGFVPLTEESAELLTAVISVPNWGEGPGYEYNYLYYEKEYPVVSFDSVGLYKVDDYTIRYVCATACDYYTFLTFCTSNWIVHEGMYEYCLESGLPYNGTPATTMSCGPYTVETTSDTTMTLVRNEAYWEYDEDENGNVTSTTFFEVDGGYVAQFVTDRIVITNLSNEEATEAYLNGELDVWTPSADQLLSYTNSDRLYRASETFTMRLIFHTNLDTLKALDAAGNTNSVVLSSDKFREAMSLAINRAEFITATSGYEAAFGLLNSVYYYDVYGNPSSIYRNTDQAKEAICNLYGIGYGPGTEYATLDDAYASITGYDPAKAKTLFAQACAELIAAGLYKKGEPIVIEMAWMKDALDTVNLRQVALLNKSLNEALDGTGFGSIELKAVGNIEQRYEDVCTGKYAIGWGAWGGAAFYPFSMLRVYCDNSYVSYIHEGGCWDPETETLTMTINGEEVTMTWQEWSKSMIGTGQFADADDETKLTVLSSLEERYLDLYYCIPICSTTSCTVLSSKIDWYTDAYNIMYGFGGMRLMRYNYTDSQWDGSTEESVPDHTPSLVSPELRVSEDSAGRPKLLWSYVPGAEAYEIYRADSENGMYTRIATTEHLEYVDETAEGGCTYFYKVCAISGDRVSEFTTPAQGTCRHIASGETGDVRWQLTTDGTLLIHGSGKMADYTESQPGPWMDWRTSIKKIVIADGVTHVGAYAFHGGFGSNGGSATPQNALQPIISGISTYSTTTLTTVSDETTTVDVTVGSSVETVGSGAFAECTEVEEIVFTGDTAPTLEDETALPETVVVYHTEEAAQSWAEVTVVTVETKVMTAPAFELDCVSGTFTTGSTITLSVTGVSGSPAPTLQWQYSLDGMSWTNISGATGTTYTVSNADFPDSGYYRCVVSNEVGTAVSDVICYTFAGEEIDVNLDGTSATVTVRNMADVARTGIIYCAAYDENGRMLDIFAISVTLAVGSQITETQTFTTSGEIADVRVFFVASGSYVPFCNAG